MDPFNLIYNGDFSQGMDGWSTQNSATSNMLQVENNIATFNTRIFSLNSVPMIQGCTYRFSYQVRLNEDYSTGSLLASFLPYDSRGISIGTQTIARVKESDTVLGAELNSGDSTVTLAENFPEGWTYLENSSNKYFGVCNNIAWGYKRAASAQMFDSIDENGVITLTSPWTGNTFPAGTKVSQFSSGSTYCYPQLMPFSRLEKDIWYKYTLDVLCSDSEQIGPGVNFSAATYHPTGSPRLFTQYIRVAFLYTGIPNNVFPSISVKNVTLENITIPQTLDYHDTFMFLDNSIGRGYDGSFHNISFHKDGIMDGLFKEHGKRVRYIKDYVNGNTINTGCHWCEIQAYDMYGNNVAFASSVKIENSNNGSTATIPVETNYVTDGSTLSSPYNQRDNAAGDGVAVIVDLGYIRELRSVKVWHYWADGRTYNDHTMSVSTNGETWEQVYYGTHKETSEGFEVILTDGNKISPDKRGTIAADDFIEY